MLSDTSLTATFAISSYTIAVASTNTTMGSTSGGGSYAYLASATFSATANTGYHFVCWNDGVTSASRMITVTGNASYRATFAPNVYTLTLSSADIAMGNVSGGGNYNYSATATLTATANNGYHFVSWNDGNTHSPRTVTVSGDANYTATFAPNVYRLTVHSAADTMGTVAGDGSYDYNTTVSLVATAATGYHFTGWSDGNTENPRTVTVTGNASYTASFVANVYVISVNSNNATMGSASGSGSFSYHTAVTLTAVANAGYHFTSWNDGASALTRTITVTGDASYTANFAINTYTLTVASADTAMGSTTGTGTYNYNTVATLAATPRTGYHFVSWNDGVTTASRTLAVAASATYVASFAPNVYTIGATSANGIMGNVSGGGSYSYHTLATLTATANAGYHFVSWNDGSSNNPRVLTVTGDASYIASFLANIYTLAVSSGNSAMGSVSGSGSYSYLATATLTATPAEGYQFLNWNDGNSDNPRTVTVTSDAAYTASFGLIPPTIYTLTVQSADTAMGSVAGGGSYIDGTLAAVSAAPHIGYHFTAWNDGSTSNPRNITVTADATFIASFSVNSYLLTAASADTAMGSATGGGNYNYRTTATLTANARHGYHFTNWNDGNTSNPRTVTVTEDISYTATFAANSYTLTAASANAAMGNATGSGNYDYLTAVTLTAVANTGYHFVNWNDGSTSAIRTVTMRGDITYTANFAANAYMVTAQSADTAMGNVENGGMYYYNTTATLIATARTGYHFISWNDGVATATRSITVRGNATYVAAFAPNVYMLTVSGSNATMGHVAGGGSYNYATTATLTATANAGYHFSQWSDGISDNPRIVSVTGNATYVATFVPNIYTVAVASDNAGMGSVSGSGSYNYGSTATLTATANTGYHFENWSDGVPTASRTIVVTCDATYTATFVPNSYLVSVASADTSRGQVSGGGSYNYNTTATLTAIARNGYRFVRWNDGNTSAVRTISVTNDVSYTASFSPDSYMITAVSADIAMGNVTGGGSYDYLATVTLTAIANAGYHFASWNDGSISNPHVVTVRGDTTYTATFAANSYRITANSTNNAMGNVSGGGDYDYLSTAELTATPVSGYYFVSWNDGNTDNPRSISVTGTATYSATFGLIPPTIYTLTVSSANTSTGTAHGGGSYADGTVATLTATAITGYHFTAWNDGLTANPRSVNVVSDTAFVASFVINSYSVTAASADTMMGTVSGSGSYDYNTIATLTASALAHYHFVSWNDGITTATRTVVVTGDASYSATFAADSYAITVRSANTAMGGVYGSGSYNYLTTTTLTATANTGYHFTGWNDGNTSNPRAVIVTGATVYTASFAPNSYLVTATSTDTLKGTVAGGGSYDYNTTAVITATPLTGYHFVCWNDGVATASRSIAVTGNASYTATFAVNSYAIMVNSADLTMGRVTGSGNYNYATTATLTAMANTGYHFTAWNDGDTTNPCTVTVTGSDTYTATFAANSYTISAVSYNTAQGVVSGSGTYSYNTTATLTAIANAGYHFTGWNDGLSTAARTVTVTANATYTATFAPNVYTLTVNSSNVAMGNVSGSGSYNYLGTATLAAMANTGYHFVSWSDGDTAAIRLVTVTSDANYTANFVANSFVVTASSSNATMGNVTGSGSYSYGTTAMLSATANTGYHFTSWNDGVASATRTVTVTGNVTYTASFAANSYAITAVSSDAAMGSATGSGSYNYNAVVSLTAMPHTGYHFTAWSDGDATNPRTITVVGDATYTANFAINSYALAVSSNDTMMGSVTGSGSYDYNATATLTATAATGYHFVSWNDGNADNPRTVTVTGDATYTATFAINSYTLTVTSADAAMGTVTGGGSYDYNVTVTLTATANTGYHFVSWNDGNTANPRTVTVTGDATYTATFAVNSYTLTVSSADATMGSVTGGGSYDYNATATLTATASAGHRFVSWNDGNTDNPRTVTVTGDATYIASFQTVGIQEASALLSLSLYPNPTEGAVTLSAETVLRVEVIDGVGRMVATYSNQSVLDLSALPAGIYTLRITLPEGTAIRKVVKR